MWKFQAGFVFVFPLTIFVTMMMMQGVTVAGLNNCDDCLVFGRSGRAGRL